MDITRDDIIQRLRLTQSYVSCLANNIYNNEKLGISCKEDWTKLKLLSAYIESLECQYPEDSCTFTYPVCITNRVYGPLDGTLEAYGITYDPETGQEQYETVITYTTTGNDSEDFEAFLNQLRSLYPTLDITFTPGADCPLVDTWENENYYTLGDLTICSNTTYGDIAVQTGQSYSGFYFTPGAITTNISNSNIFTNLEILLFCSEDGAGIMYQIFDTTDASNPILLKLVSTGNTTEETVDNINNALVDLGYNIADYTISTPYDIEQLQSYFYVSRVGCHTERQILSIRAVCSFEGCITDPDLEGCEIPSSDTYYRGTINLAPTETCECSEIDKNSCLTNEQIEDIFSHISKLTGICFAPNGSTYK